MTKQERLKELYVKYKLNPEDTFKSPQGWTIITRSGIDAIQANAGIDVKFEVVEYTPGVSASVKAIGQLLEDREVNVQTYGSAIVGGYGKGTTKTLYTLEMAEKRAMSRAVLKLSGFYALGAFGEDESDDFKDDRSEINTKQLSQMKDAIIRGDYSAEEAFEKAEDAGLIIPESIKYQYKKLKVN